MEMKFSPAQLEADQYGINVLDIKNLAIEAHTNSRNKGFWDKPPTVTMTRALLHSEASEALEELRANADPGELRFEDDGKPCGFPSEIADVAIRYLDKVGEISYYGSGADGTPHGPSIQMNNLDRCVRLLCKSALEISTHPDFSAKFERMSLVDMIDELHTDISMFLKVGTLREHGVPENKVVLLGIADIADILFAAPLVTCQAIAKKAGFPLWEVVRIKMAYNAKRARMHGGKAF